MKKLWVKIVELCGWTIDATHPSAVPHQYHSVIIMAPHTSARDFFVGAACVFKNGLNAHIFLKKDYFNFFTRKFLTACGAVPVNRESASAGHALVEEAVSYFKNNENFTQIITPEGTRQAVKRWKRGFYQIAMEANVPILLAYIDFKTKHLGIGPAFFPTGDFDADMPKIMKFYENIHACYPDQYNPYYNVDPHTAKRKK